MLQGRGGDNCPGEQFEASVILRCADFVNFGDFGDFLVARAGEFRGKVDSGGCLGQHWPGRAMETSGRRLSTHQKAVLIQVLLTFRRTAGERVLPARGQRRVRLRAGFFDDLQGDWLGRAGKCACRRIGTARRRDCRWW